MIILETLHIADPVLILYLIIVNLGRYLEHVMSCIYTEHTEACDEVYQWPDQSTVSLINTLNIDRTVSGLQKLFSG